MRTVDVLDITDFRFFGGTAASVAEEVSAREAAGWTTGLVQLNSPLVPQVTAFRGRIRELVVAGSAQLLVGRDPIRTKVVLVRNPAVFEHAAAQLPLIATDRVLVIANTTMISPEGGTGYDPRRITELARDKFGVEPLWVPVSSIVRSQLERAAPELQLAADDWVTVIDPDRWQVRDSPPTGDRPVIGRHGRDARAKWPTQRSVLESVYPTDGSAEIRVLGGARSAKELLGPVLPNSWRVWDFGVRELGTFLNDVDVYVYYTDPRWIEGFGRNVLEAMAAGVPTVLPPSFEPVFGDAALYADPSTVRSVVRSLHSDRDLWLRTSVHAREVVRQRHSPQVHRDRLQALTGLAPRTRTDPPSDSIRPREVLPVTGRASATEEKPRLLLISSNGSGMGHLMRLMAYGRRAKEFEPHVLSLSQGVGAVAALGMPFEYVPSANALGMSPRNWQPIFTERVGAALDRIRPGVVVFDGVWPYSGIGVLRSTHPDPLWIWSRRGMWRNDRGGEQLEKSVWFDEVLEPGDFASAADRGATASAPAVRVPPVTLLDEKDLLDRDQARRHLGLPSDGPIALVSFSGGAVDDVTSDTAAAIAACRQLGLQICVTRSVVSPHVVLPDDVHAVNPIPLARYQRAFDVAISSAGYNSFHELLRFGTPTIFIPKRNSSYDDQDRRATWAADQGWSLYANSVTRSATVAMVADLLDHGDEMIAKVVAMDPGNGAFDAARLLADIQAGRRTA